MKMPPAREPRPQFINPILADRYDEGTCAFHFAPLSGEDVAYSSDLESSDGDADEEDFHGSHAFLLEHHP
jgi:hypothetical protein